MQLLGAARWLFNWAESGPDSDKNVCIFKMFVPIENLNLNFINFLKSRSYPREIGRERKLLGLIFGLIQVRITEETVRTVCGRHI